jgi:hypothetical protein
MDEEIQVSDVSQFKKRGGSGSIVTLPSGLNAKIRIRGMETFLKSGMIPNSLMGVVQTALEKNDPSSKKVEDSQDDALQKLMEEPDKINDLLTLVDSVTIDCFVQPRVYPVPDNQEELDDAKLYVDVLDFEDKMFVFSVAVGGTKDLETFRSGFASSVESAQLSLEVERPPFRLPGT